MIARSNSINLSCYNKRTENEDEEKRRCRWCNLESENLDHIMGKCIITKHDREWIKLENYYNCDGEKQSKELAKQIEIIEENLKTLDDDNLDEWLKINSNNKQKRK